MESRRLCAVAGWLGHDRAAYAGFALLRDPAAPQQRGALPPESYLRLSMVCGTALAPLAELARCRMLYPHIAEPVHQSMVIVARLVAKLVNDPVPPGDGPLDPSPYVRYALYKVQDKALGRACCAPLAAEQELHEQHLAVAFSTFRLLLEARKARAFLSSALAPLIQNPACARHMPLVGCIYSALDGNLANVGGNPQFPPLEMARCMVLVDQCCTRERVVRDEAQQAVQQAAQQAARQAAAAAHPAAQQAAAHPAAHPAAAHPAAAARPTAADARAMPQIVLNTPPLLPFMELPTIMSSDGNQWVRGSFDLGGRLPFSLATLDRLSAMPVAPGARVRRGVKSSKNVTFAAPTIIELSEHDEHIEPDAPAGPAAADEWEDVSGEEETDEETEDDSDDVSDEESEEEPEDGPMIIERTAGAQTGGPAGDAAGGGAGGGAAAPVGGDVGQADASIIDQETARLLASFVQ